VGGLPVMRILVIEDDKKLGFMIHYKLTQQLHNVDWVKNAEEAEAYIDSDSYDLYIVDWMMPGKSGLQLCADLRKKNDKTAILMLSARDEMSDRIKGLMQGVDDYMVKPFVFEELYARIFALDRRKQANGYEGEYVFGSLKLNPMTHEVSREGAMIHLTKKEFQLLTYFMRHTGIVLSREQILSNVWGNGATVTLNAVDTAVKLLRKKMGYPSGKEMIVNVHGLGYRLAFSEVKADV
jgi:DNA-binding response OmpR family regulator